MSRWIDEFKQKKWLIVKTTAYDKRKPGVSCDTKQVRLGTTAQVVKISTEIFSITTCPLMKLLRTYTGLTRNIELDVV